MVTNLRNVHQLPLSMAHFECKVPLFGLLATKMYPKMPKSQGMAAHFSGL